MSGALDMSLDDIIKKNKNSAVDSNPRFRGRFSGGGPAAGPGPTRRSSNRSANRSNPYASVPRAPESTWQHDMYADQVPAAGYASAAGGRASAIETGTKLYISNLDYGVSNEDIKELFSEVGDVKRFSIHYDRSGRSKGTAEVVFTRRQDASAAVKRYNNVQLDGKPMKIEIVGTNNQVPPAPLAPPQVLNGGFGNFNGPPRSFPARGGFNGLSRGSGGGGGGRGGGGRGRERGRGRGRGRTEPVSAADLDADLAKYHSEAMETN